MKKGIKLALFGVGLFALAGFGVGLTLKQEAKINEPIIVLAEGEGTETETETEVLPCQVVIEAVEHGSITTDISEGNVGDICTITAKHDLLYKVSHVSVNGVELIESETISGEFSFALVEGTNTITASFVVDEELCGSLTDIINEAIEQDWDNLFTVENVITLVKWVLDGGILIAMIRYYVKDKKLEKKLEDKVQSTVQKIIPETTKNTVVATVEKVIEPMFTEIKADYIEMMKALGIFAKCTALSQENTPDSRRAILDELSGLKIGDLETIGEVKKYIEEMVEKHNKAYEETLAAIKELGQKQDAYIGNVEEVSVKEEEPEIEQEETEIKKQATE